jgi:succinate dehydrogenase / fumarate reductase membrane anchor subunit
MKETQLKILQYISGIALFFFVGAHLLVSHLSSGEPTTWESVSERATSSGWLTFYILLLIFGIYHGLHGLRTIILEFSIPNSAVKVLDRVLLAVGLAVFGYAVYIPINAFIIG